MTEVFPTAEKRELLDALRQAYRGTPNHVGEFGEYCGYCNACIDCKELHDETCPNRKIEALLKQWEGQ